MEDNLEKITINIDTEHATFLNDYEFFVDILDDIKNVLYVKTLKTEIYVKRGYTYVSKYDKLDKDYFKRGDYIYVTLNNFNRINVVSKEIVPQTLADHPGSTDTLSVEKRYDMNGMHLLATQWDTTGSQILYKNSNGVERDYLYKPLNFLIKDERYNLLKYYDAVNIKLEDEIGTVDGASSMNPNHYIFKQELTGTSCGPNDTNTLVINPIEPELKRFTVKLWSVNEDGAHELLKISNNKKWVDTEGVFRVVMSFTIYYKRKNITRV
tara:strand:+ start:8412 stop:9212 length:801 start_codon:yes stop_codon:yes gene_type:complete